MTRVLVTGASGYLGQWTCVALRNAGYQVRGYARSDRPAQLADVEWARGDIAAGAELAEALRGCQRVAHLACLPMNPSNAQPSEAERVNALGTLRVLEAACAAGVEHVLYTSTASVYGTTRVARLGEDDALLPDTIYGASKLAGELWCDVFQRLRGLPRCTLRIFNVYGRAADGSVRPTVESIFLRELQSGRAPVIKGNPENARDFVHVSDVTQAIVRAVEGQRGVFNVGTGIATTLRELSSVAASLVGVGLVASVNGGDAERTYLVADPTRAARALGFEPRVSLADGLRTLLAA